MQMRLLLPSVATSLLCCTAPGRVAGPQVAPAYIHPSRCNTLRCAANDGKDLESKLIPGLVSFLAGTAPAGSTNKLEKTKKSLGSLKRAFDARGESDFEIIRAAATAFGFGEELDAFASEVFGVSNSSNAAGAELMENVAQIASAAKSVLTENKQDVRVRRALAIATALFLIELAQFVLVLPASWLIGAGLSVPGGAPSPLAAALGVTLRSRAVTRPLRLVLQIWLSLRVNRQLQDWSPPKRVGRLRNYALVLLGCVAASGLLLVQCDRVMSSAGRAAATSMLGSSTLLSKGYFPPLVTLFRALSELVKSALAPIGLASLVDPTAVAGATSTICAFLRVRMFEFAAACQVLSDSARTIKPLRALLDLSETDMWLVDGLRELPHRVQQALPFLR